MVERKPEVKGRDIFEIFCTCGLQKPQVDSEV